MSIVTKCPSCGTTFRVTPQQLQAQHGMVRCGRCANVFDGFKTLATLTETARSDTPPPQVAPRDEASDAAAAAREVATPAVAASAAEVRQGEEIRFDASAAVPAENPPLATEMPHSEEISLEPAVELPAASPPPPAPPPEPEELVVFDTPASPAQATVAPQPLPIAPEAIVKRAPRRRTGGWVFGSLLLLAALAGQGIFLYRSEIAATLPEARPYLNKMCELLRCTVALPQRPRQISIEASDMQATDPANPGVIALTATLRNHASIELGYPALDVVLTNTKEHTVARRIFLPADYLGGKDPRAGIAPNAEITVRLDLDTGDLGAAGFRLDVLAAPPG